jgi:Domain of unknown function (DUF4286)
VLIHNRTLNVDINIASEWLQWELEEHIPKIMKTGLFDDFKILELLEQEDPEGKTFIIQFWTGDPKSYDIFMREFEQNFRREEFDKWGNQVIGFRSLLRIVKK